MRTLSVLLFLLLIPASTLAQPVSLGSRPPGLNVQAWIDSAPAKDADITVVMFIGTWCPVTRAVFDRLDPQLAALDAQIVAITPEPASLGEEFLRIGDWQGVVLGLDPDREVRAAWFGDDARNSFLPFAFVIAGRGKGRVLWSGRVAEPSLEDPLGPFEAVLAAVAEGTWTVGEAQIHAQKHEQAASLLRNLQQGSTPEWYDEQLAYLDQTDIPTSLQRDAANRLNQAAWVLATDEPDEFSLDVAYRAVQMALGLGGDTDPAIVDTHARVLWELGRRDEALTVQTEAVALAEGSHWYGDLAKVLCSYAEEMGSAPPAACAPGPWSANINDTFGAFSGADVVLVRPAPQKDRKLEARWVEEMASLGDRFFPGTPLKHPDEVTDEDREGRLLVLYGAPGDNAVTAAVLAHHGITLDEGGVAFGSTHVPLEDPFLIAALPNPWRHDLPVLLYTARDDGHAHHLNGVFHGPTSVVLGSAGGGDDAHTVQANAVLDDNVVVALDLMPPELSSEQATQDLQALHDALRDRYAGYADLQWLARAEGATTEDRRVAFEEKIATQEAWTDEAFFALVVEYLAPVQDTHFHLSGMALGGEGTRELRARMVDSLEPYFADGVVDETAFEIPVLPEPHAVEAGVPHLFPTFPDDEGKALYLVGVLADPNDPPSSIELRQDGAVVPVPVHRGRVNVGHQDQGWALHTPDDVPLPVLHVTTMRESRLDGLAATADSLRQESAVVLDLRGNGGGSDSPAREWCSRFTHQWFRWSCHAQVVRGETEPLRHWYSGSDHAYILHGGDAAQHPYEGKLFVLTDTGVASSGETFTFLSSQIDAAVVVGENTSGCMDYGNADQEVTLANSRIRLWFGRSRFVWQCVRPAAEGVGIFPDYWLDVEDPVGWLSENAVE